MIAAVKPQFYTAFFESTFAVVKLAEMPKGLAGPRHEDLGIVATPDGILTLH